MKNCWKTITAVFLMAIAILFTGCRNHDYVDLGLPSGTLWATCNVGAYTPEGYGDYFAWGETRPKSSYEWGTYKYCKGDQDKLTKYCTDSDYGYNGFTDNLTQLQPSDDAATANWGDEWCMPTKEQWEELFQNTTETWTTRKGVEGRLFTASNGESLFFPATRSGGEVGSYGGYWSSSLGTDDPRFAWCVYMYSAIYGININYFVCRDLSVRAVRSSCQK